MFSKLIMPMALGLFSTTVAATQFNPQQDSAELYQQLEKQVRTEAWQPKPGNTNSKTLSSGKRYVQASYTGKFEQNTTTQLISNVSFNDINLRNCVTDHANTYGWTQVSQVYGLDCDSYSISNLGGIEAFDQMFYLFLSDNQITDLSPLASLNGLTALHLHNNQISNISALSGLNQLQELLLDNNQVSDLTALAGFANLTRLHASNNQIVDVGPLSHVLALEYLLLDRNQISDISYLEDLVALKTLFLHTNQISNIAALSRMNQLERLHLSDNSISDLSPIAGATTLQWLLLSNNQVSDVSPLSQLTALQLLDLNLNAIVNIAPLANLDALNILYLAFNQIQQVPAGINWTQVHTLLLHNNQLTQTNNLAGLSAIQALTLQFNNLNTVAGLSQLTTAQMINITYNPDLNCADIDALENALGYGILIRPAQCPGIPLYGESCQAIATGGNSVGDGFYMLDPDGEGPLEPYESYCNMSTEGGGWTLYATHSIEPQVVVADTVSPDANGVLNDERWMAIKSTMTVGMMFIDVEGRVSLISKEKLVNGNCVSVNDVTSLINNSNSYGRIWHNETSGCGLSGVDYSLIILTTNSVYGASIYNVSNVKFDTFGYSPYGSSYSHTKTLRYYIK